MDKARWGLLKWYTGQSKTSSDTLSSPPSTSGSSSQSVASNEGYYLSGADRAGQVQYERQKHFIEEISVYSDESQNLAALMNLENLSADEKKYLALREKLLVRQIRRRRELEEQYVADLEKLNRWIKKRRDGQ